MILLEAIYFLILVFLFLYIPGRFALRISKFPITDSLIRMPLELGIGTSFFIAFVYFLSWLHIDIFYLLVLLPIIFLEIKSSIRLYKKQFISLPLFETSIIILGSFIALYITGRSGIEVDGKLFFYGVNSTDAVFHISLIGNLMHHFPPTHAGMAGVSLHGYNFLYDLLVASFAKFFFLHPLDLFFRFFSLFVSIFYGLSSLALARFMKMDKVTTRFFIFLAYFAQGTIFIFHYFHVIYDPAIVQPIANIVDPSVIFSVSLLFLSFILFFSTERKSHIAVTAIMLSIIPMIKIYTAFLLFIALAVVTCISVIKNKKEKWLYVTVMILAGMIGGAIYAPINLGVGKLIFAPFLFYSHFMESFAPLNHSDWWLRMLVYFEHKNYIRIVQNYALLLLLFFIPSLSLRLFSIFSIKKVLNKNFYSLPNIFWISAIVLGILIPSFFIQNIAVFVVVQFLWITYFLLLIPAAYGLTSVYTFLPKIGKIILVTSVILISLPDLVSLISLYSREPVIIPSSTVAIAKEIKLIVPQVSTVLVLNAHKEGNSIQLDYSVPLVSAISQHDVYYEPEVLEFTGLDNEVKARTDLAATIDETLSKCPHLMSTNDFLVSKLKLANISYIVTLKNKPCLTLLPSFTLLSQKGDAALYKLR